MSELVEIIRKEGNIIKAIKVAGIEYYTSAYSQEILQGARQIDGMKSDKLPMIPHIPQKIDEPTIALYETY